MTMIFLCIKQIFVNWMEATQYRQGTGTGMDLHVVFWFDGF